MHTCMICHKAIEGITEMDIVFIISIFLFLIYIIYITYYYYNIILYYIIILYYYNILYYIYYVYYLLYILLFHSIYILYIYIYIYIMKTQICQLKIDQFNNLIIVYVLFEFNGDFHLRIHRFSGYSFKLVYVW